jgi:hypothetical protein
LRQPQEDAGLLEVREGLVDDSFRARHGCYRDGQGDHRVSRQGVDDAPRSGIRPRINGGSQLFTPLALKVLDSAQVGLGKTRGLGGG